MHFATLLVAAVAALATSKSWSWECAYQTTVEDKESIARLSSTDGPSNQTSVPIDDLNINVYWHVVTRRSHDIGDLSRDTLKEQLDVLNEDFAPHNISFFHAGVNWTFSPSADTAGAVGELAMKSALRTGSYADLNVYFVPSIPGVSEDHPYFGTATFPGAVVPNTKEFLLDGVMVPFAMAPYEDIRDFGWGHALTHQVGHWLGLFHVFEGFDCDGEGDYIEDTPATLDAHASNATCDILQDSCPEQLGADPVTNFMDWSGDDCWSKFTPGQGARMRNMWYTFRANSTT